MSQVARSVLGCPADRSKHTRASFVDTPGHVDSLECYDASRVAPIGSWSLIINECHPRGRRAALQPRFSDFEKYGTADDDSHFDDSLCN